MLFEYFKNTNKVNKLRNVKIILKIYLRKVWSANELVLLLTQV